MSDFTREIYSTAIRPPTLTDCDFNRHIMAWDSWYCTWQYETGIMENGNVGILPTRYPFWFSVPPIPEVSP